MEPGSNPKTLNDFVEPTLYGAISCSVKSRGGGGRGSWSCLKDVGTVDFSGGGLTLSEKWKRGGVGNMRGAGGEGGGIGIGIDK